MTFRMNERGGYDVEDVPCQFGTPAEFAAAVRAGARPDDHAFDRFLPLAWRRMSGLHWTPLDVCFRVAEWIERYRIRHVVDLGSGAGKFCVATALASGCTFTGVEQREGLVASARALAEEFGVEDRVRFVRATIGIDVMPTADAYYLFNPFGENLFGPDGTLGDDVELGTERYERDVESARQLLDGFRAGTYVLKYNGYGAKMPHGYRELLVDRELPNVLRLWRKRRVPRPAPSPGETWGSR